MTEQVSFVYADGVRNESEILNITSRHNELDRHYETLSCTVQQLRGVQKVHPHSHLEGRRDGPAHPDDDPTSDGYASDHETYKPDKLNKKEVEEEEEEEIDIEVEK